MRVCVCARVRAGGAGVCVCVCARARARACACCLVDRWVEEGHTDIRHMRACARVRVYACTRVHMHKPKHAHKPHMCCGVPIDEEIAEKIIITAIATASECAH